MHLFRGDLDESEPGESRNRNLQVWLTHGISLDVWNVFSVNTNEWIPFKLMIAGINRINGWKSEEWRLCFWKMQNLVDQF